LLTRILEDAVSSHPPPNVQWSPYQDALCPCGGQNPPIVIIHGNQVDKVPDHYTRYLENVYRKALQLSGTPLRIEFRNGENPFRGAAQYPDAAPASRSANVWCRHLQEALSAPDSGVILTCNMV
jgi:hypothetical protein